MWGGCFLRLCYRYDKLYVVTQVDKTLIYLRGNSVGSRGGSDPQLELGESLLEVWLSSAAPGYIEYRLEAIAQHRGFAVIRSDSDESLLVAPPVPQPKARTTVAATVAAAAPIVPATVPVRHVEPPEPLEAPIVPLELQDAPEPVVDVLVAPASILGAIVSKSGSVRLDVTADTVGSVEFESFLSKHGLKQGWVERLISGDTKSYKGWHFDAA